MAFADQGHSITDLLGGLASDISGLFRKEIQLAKAEASEKLDHALSAGRNVAIGGVLAIGAVGVFLAALVSGLAALFVAWFGWQEPAANFVAAVIVTVVIGAVAWAMIQKGIAEFKANKMNMERTTQSLAMDAATVRESI